MTTMMPALFFGHGNPMNTQSHHRNLDGDRGGGSASVILTQTNKFCGLSVVRCRLAVG